MDIITSIASKIGESLLEPIGRQIGYLIFYEGNIRGLADETNKLKDKRAGIQRLKDAATRDSKIILPEIMRWISEADEMMNELERFLEEDVKAKKMCLNGWCPNLKQRYLLGRKAKKNIEVVSKLQQEGNFARISYPAPPSAMKAFESRTEILKQVKETLRDKNMHIIAICGMGGIGKTMMAKEVARRAKEEKLFNEVVMATASQTPDVMKIQGEIADSLDMRFQAESATRRAEELYGRIKGIDGRILIIIDDIWDEFDLLAVGIPYGSEHPGCTILLTSRSESPCSQMKSQKTFIIEVLSEEGNFARISYPAPPVDVHLLPLAMKAFESRTKILKQVMETLRDKNMHIIAFCGIGGIGKTMMAKEVARRAKEEKLFGEVVMATASQTPDVMKIQGEIADSLGMRFKAERAIGRAGELYGRIKGIDGRILIIIDDIWDEFDLQAVGIPYGSEHPGCTILLTSRSESACSQMKSQKTFTIEVLSEDEAWNLFEEVAGTSINASDLRPIAQKIVKECGGLPVAIVTVGGALRNRGKEEWIDALIQLQQSISENIPGMDENGYKSIELSYIFLRST